VAVRLDGADERLNACLEEANSLASGAWDERDRDELLYAVEKLRKHDMDGHDED
jgi:hypothetical protein